MDFESLGKLDDLLARCWLLCQSYPARHTKSLADTELLYHHRLPRFFGEFLKAPVATQRVPNRQQF